MAVTQITIASPAAEVVFTDTAMGATVDGIKASSAKVFYVTVDNSLNVVASYVKFYNLASGSVTVGTTVPDEVIYVPAGVGITQQYYTGSAPGKTFGTALSAACVTTGGTVGNTGPSSNVLVTVNYV